MSRSRPKRRRSAPPAAVLLAVLLLPVAAAGGGDALPAPLRPFEAVYRVVKGPLRLGTTTVDLQPRNAGWRYSSVTRADGLFALLVDGEARELATLELHDDGLRPRRYVHDEPDDADDVRMDFDWDAGRARVVRDGRTHEVATEAGMHDQFSVVLAMMRAVAGGAASASVPGIDDEGERVDFRFEVTGRETIEAPFGRYETLRVRRIRDDDRSTITWLAPALGWLPVAIEQRREGDLVARMELESLDGRTGDAEARRPEGR